MDLSIEGTGGFIIQDSFVQLITDTIGLQMVDVGEVVNMLLLVGQKQPVRMILTSLTIEVYLQIIP